MTRVDFTVTQLLHTESETTESAPEGMYGGNGLRLGVYSKVHGRQAGELTPYWTAKDRELYSSGKMRECWVVLQVKHVYYYLGKLDFFLEIGDTRVPVKQCYAGQIVKVDILDTVNKYERLPETIILRSASDSLHEYGIVEVVSIGYEYDSAEWVSAGIDKVLGRKKFANGGIIRPEGPVKARLYKGEYVMKGSEIDE